MLTINQGGRLDAGMQRDDISQHGDFPSANRSFKSHGDVVIQRRRNYMFLFILFGVF